MRIPLIVRDTAVFQLHFAISDNMVSLTRILNIMNLLKNIDFQENDKEYFGKFESQEAL